MPPGAAVPTWTRWLVFLAPLLGKGVGSVQLTKRRERVGARLRLSEGLLGLVASLGADAPEICSAFAAVLAGQEEVGLGVVLGSNIFDLAGLLGRSALVAGRVTIGREGLWLNGATGLLPSAVVLALVLGGIPFAACLALLLLIFVPYAALLALRAPQLARIGLPAPARRFLVTAIGHAHRDVCSRTGTRAARWRDAGGLLVSLLLVVASSAAALHSALALAARWQLGSAVVGMLVLAALTSIPNVVVAVQLAREGRGAAVVSESLNSNALNLLVGIGVPGLVLGLGPASPRVVFAASWLLAMKLVALLAASPPHGLHRAGGAALVALYLTFCAVVASWP